MIYDQDIVDWFRQFSVKTSDELVAGTTYYTHGLRGSGFVFLGNLETKAERYKRLDLYREGDDDTQPQFFEVKYLTRKSPTWESLHDRNINGGGYNPWLVFAKKEHAEAYTLMLKISFEDTKHYEPYEDDYEPCIYGDEAEHELT